MGISTASSFKSKNSQTLELPSGETALCRRGGIEVFLRSGKVPNSLLPIMKAAMLGKAEEAKKLQEETLEVDDNTIREMFEMFDLVATTVMIQPKCHSVPMKEVDGVMVEGERKDDLLYVDEVDLEDKQFLFQWAVGGTADVERFRNESAQRVAALLPSEEVSGSSELPPPSP
jgi:hypothetical protein